MLRQFYPVKVLFLTTLTAAGLAAASAALAGDGTDGLTVGAAVIEGQNVDGVGAITRIDTFAINNLGEWLVEADTDHADTDADSVLLRMDGLYLREGDPLAAPAGAALDSFDSIVINVNGDSFWNFFLDNLPIGEDSGLYFNDTLVIQESTISTAPEFSANTPYIGFFETKWNDNNSALVMASVDDPNIPSSVDRGLVVIDYDPGTGDYTEEVIAKEGDILPGQKDPLADFETNTYSFAYSNSGSVMFIADLSGDTSIDSAIYVDDELVAQEGFLSPIEGVIWDSLSSARVDVNGSGDWAFRGRLDTALDDVIIKNGDVFIREGDTPPGFDGFSITSLGAGPVLLNNGGDVVWSAEWDDPDDTLNSGIFLNDAILVQEGVTSVNGRVIDTLRDVRGSRSTDASGGWIIFEAVLDTGQEGAFIIEIPTSASPADLTGFEILTGGLLDGGLDDLGASDDVYVHTISGFGQTFVNLHNMTMTIDAITAEESPSTLNIEIESRIDEPSGTARIRLRNWATGQFETVDTYTVDMDERSRQIEVTGAADYVSDSGEIEMEIRHVVIVPIFAFTFESFFDRVGILVE